MYWFASLCKSSVCLDYTDVRILSHSAAVIGRMLNHWGMHKWSVRAPELEHVGVSVGRVFEHLGVSVGRVLSAQAFEIVHSQNARPF